MTQTTTTEDRLTGVVVDGRFRLDRLLGKGGMGRVYAGTQLSVGRKVAIKVLREDISDSEIVQRRFFREAQVAAAIRHPNVVSIIDFGRDETLDALYIVMEYVEGKSLAAMLRKGRLRLPLALHVTRQICSGLSEAHAAGIVHRDLKPDNVMLQLTAEGAVTARLLDFGIALPSGKDTRFTATGAVVGTPHYMSPEQAHDQDVDARTDLHALGVMLYEMLTGRLPWVAETPMAVLLKVVTSPPPPLEDALSPEDLPPPSVRALVDRLLQKSPDDRPGSAAEVGRQVDQLLIELGLGSVAAPTLDALSDAEVVDRESDELVLAQTATQAATPSPPQAAPRRSPSPPSSTPTPPPVVPSKPQGWHPIWAIPVTVFVLATFCTGSIVILAIIGSEEEGSAAKTADEPAKDVVTASVDAVPEPPRLSDGVVLPREEPDVGRPTESLESKSTGKNKGKKKKNRKQKRLKPPRADLENLVLEQGGVCPDHKDCNFGPKARAMSCRSDSTCSGKCTAGGCPQLCEGESDCRFDCPGGRCKQICGEQADCTFTCNGGGCNQHCSGQANCELSCKGTNCDVVRVDQASVTQK